MTTIVTRQRNIGKKFGDGAGYSAVEMMMTLALISLLGGMAVVQISQSVAPMKADGGMRVVLSQLNTARQLAISQRKYMRVTFVGNNQIGILREDAPAATTTVISTVLFEGGVQMVLVTGVPDTPDLFGKATAVDFGTATEVKFGPDGTLVNQSGATLNGTVFVASPGVVRSARAVTVLGSTGRVRGYKWDGLAWKLV
jgi:Tfp pilus assembly protein FimT